MHKVYNTYKTKIIGQFNIHIYILKTITQHIAHCEKKKKKLKQNILEIIFYLVFLITITCHR